MPNLSLNEVTDLASTLTDWEFETLIRTRLRQHIVQLETVTDGHSSNNSISLYFSNIFVQWSVTAGKTYSDSHTSKGEVLSAVVRAAVHHGLDLDMTKMSLLAAPTFLSEPPPAPEPIADYKDNKIPF